jgi:hypothetical protein
MDRIIHADGWGEIIDRPDADLLELRWFDTTVAMTKEQFQAWLIEFADRAVQTRRSRVLIDATAFQIARSNMDGEWRDANIIPRYNHAGVSKFAFSRKASHSVSVASRHIWDAWATASKRLAFRTGWPTAHATTGRPARTAPG